VEQASLANHFCRSRILHGPWLQWKNLHALQGNYCTKGLIVKSKIKTTDLTDYTDFIGGTI
jgi:hypothetical protein